MNPEIERHVSRAEELLNVAGELIALGYPADSVSRSYYAMFHGASAVLLHLGIERGSHHGVWAAFGQFVAKEGLMEPRLHRAGLEAFAARVRSDYLSEPPESLADSEAALVMAREFVAACRSFLAGQ